MKAKREYDYLLVGAGLFNAIFAYMSALNSKKCLVIERRPYVGGNLYCENIEGINVHKYGAHIFHTKNKYIWKFMEELCEFNHYINSPLARYKDELYNLPFNMNTFYQLWGTKTPDKALQKLESQRSNIINVNNFEEQALKLVGEDIYIKLIKGYTEKQWGKETKDLPAFLINRIPLRFNFDNNYFEDPYQGIPIGGYNHIFDKCFEKADIMLNTDYFNNKSLCNKANQIIFSGMIDQYYDYCYGQLEYRSLYFEHQILNIANYQGNAVVNYTDKDIPYTRILEHKHFEFGKQSKTVITREYPIAWHNGLEPYYPVNTDVNQIKLAKYQYLAKKDRNIYFGGRLGSYRYYDMDQVVKSAIDLFESITK